MNDTWKEDYVSLLAAKEDVRAIMLKDSYLPKALFKYKSLSNNTLENLEFNWLWVAEIDSLNDPFECSLSFDRNNIFKNSLKSEQFQTALKEKFSLEISKNDLEPILNSQDPLSEFINYLNKFNINLRGSQKLQFATIDSFMNRLQQEAKQWMKVCSFSERNDLSLLWSHYSDMHKGICIEYDFLDSSHIRPFLQPVLYTEKVFRINAIEDLNGLNHILATLYKANEWSYEKEWRLTYFLDTQFPDKPNQVKVPVPKAIYVGIRFYQNSEYLQYQLKRIANNLNIPIWQMKPHPNEYKLIKDTQLY